MANALPNMLVLLSGIPRGLSPPDPGEHEQAVPSVRVCGV
jgi:hypothetical protein